MQYKLVNLVQLIYGIRKIDYIELVVHRTNEFDCLSEKKMRQPRRKFI
jgi:hypothetical protein